jgi:hypothetical protein
MKKQISLTTFLVGFLYLASCNKQNNIHTPTRLKCESSNTVYLPTDIRSRFYFKVGTWWAYKNLNNTEIDTVKVTRLDRYIQQPSAEQWGNVPNKCYEWIRVAYHPLKYFDYTTFVDFIRPKPAMDSTKEEYLITDDYNYYNQILTSYKFRYNGLNLLKGQDSGYFEIINSMQIESKIYTDIIKYNTRSQYDYITEAYYAKDYGIIKMTRLDGTSWELINSNIIK